MLARWQNQSYSGGMRGGLERWKRGAGSRGVRQAIDYALKGTCDAHLHHSTGSDALEVYSLAADASVTRFVVTDGGITADELSAGALRVWLTGHDPVTGEERGTQRLSADADLLARRDAQSPQVVQHRRAAASGSRDRVRGAAGPPARPDPAHLASTS